MGPISLAGPASGHRVRTRVAAAEGLRFTRVQAEFFGSDLKVPDRSLLQRSECRRMW